MRQLSDVEVYALLELITKDEYDPLAEKCFGATYRTEWYIEGKKYLLYKHVGADMVDGFEL